MVRSSARLALALVFVALVTFAAIETSVGAPENPVEAPVDFVRDIRPLLSKNCFACHGPDEGHRKADLRLDTEKGAFAEISGGHAVVAGNVDDSELYQRLIAEDKKLRMPPAESGKQLTPEQIQLFKRWIEQGAKWGTHWSFTKPERPALPTVKNDAWVKNDIDRFILGRLEKEGLQPSPRADLHTLARRLSFDLTGLPPTPEQVDSFTKDASAAAYERFVDSLLKSPAYGERFARVWLDLARYADTKGYEKDRERKIWKYRDWVIKALNDDMPFDQFTAEQIAGDLLPQATDSQLIATAFNRNTMTNDEGGTDNEEFRVAAVKDRVDTTLQVWMGLTVGCAKCHSHKYDPITQRDYYRMYAFFNQTEDADRSDDAPLLATPSPEQKTEIARVDAALVTARAELRKLSPEFEAEQAGWEKSVNDYSAWVVLKPTTMESKGGATLKLLEDGSTLVNGTIPDRDTYRLVLPTDLPKITAIRLETIPDPSLPKTGAGRAKGDGDFVLSQVSLAVKPAGANAAVEVRFAKAEADVSQDGFGIESAINNSDLAKKGWAVAPFQPKAHTAAFTTAMSVTAGPGAELTVTLDQQYEKPAHTLGRFRISATSDPQPALAPAVPENILKIAKTPAAMRTPAQVAELLTFYVALSPLKKTVREQIAALETERKGVDVPQTPIMRDLAADKQRTTKLHVRGNFLDQGEEVKPAVLAEFHPLPAGVLTNRLGVARWLVDANNPLTSRVMANRFWAQLFGTGLVETEEDFGTQGLQPSHPELLDWLATEFSRQGWSMKKFAKTIVMSATYQQSSHGTPELNKRDRFNRLLARGPRFRLEAEMVRDNALAVSGLLSRKMFGPSVMPPQPPGIWQSTYNTDKWTTSPSEDKYRRGLYTFIKRTSPYPSMITFDAPSREVCTVRRISTNTPLQALVTLNDPVYIEAAQALARRMAKEGGTTPAERIAYVYRIALSRPPQQKEIDQLTGLYERRLKFYRIDKTAAKDMATSQLGALPEGWDESELAAWTTVCNVLLNLDEFLTRG